MEHSLENSGLLSIMSETLKSISLLQRVGLEGNLKIYKTWASLQTFAERQAGSLASLSLNTC